MAEHEVAGGRVSPAAARLWFGGFAAILVLAGVLLMLVASRESATDRSVEATIVSSGCTVTVQAATSVTSFHVDLCPSIPAGATVRLVSEDGQVVELWIGSAEVDVTTSPSSLDVTAGVFLLIFGGAFLLIFAAAASRRIRRLPRPTSAMFAVLVAEVVVPSVIGLIATLQPLHPDTGAALRAVAIGAAFGVLLAGATAYVARHEGFHRAA